MASGDTGGNPPSTAELMSWAETYDMVNVPVLGFKSQDQRFPSGMSYTYEIDMYIPTVYHLSPQMEVLSADRGVTNPGAFIDD